MPKFFKKEGRKNAELTPIDEIAYNAKQLKDSRLVRVFRLNDLEVLLRQVHEHFQILESQGDRTTYVHYKQGSAHYKRLREYLITIRNDLVQTLTFIKLHADELEEKGEDAQQLNESFKKGNALVKKLNGGEFLGKYETGLLGKIERMESIDIPLSES